MKVFALSDPHLGEMMNKPMDVFGGNWIDGYWEKVKKDWQERVTDEDVVLLAGDISWAMYAEQALPDLQEIDALPGQKVITRGNHDYWWMGPKKLSALPLKTIRFVQNNALKIGRYIFCGTRGWTVPEGEHHASEEDEKIFQREILRLGLTLKEGKKLQLDGEEIICMMHYPPFNSKFEDSPFVNLILENGVKCVVYGHLHGNESRYKAVVDKYGTPFFLTSCDFLCNRLLLIDPKEE